MKTLFAMMVAGLLSFGLAGCNGQSATTKTQTTVSGPGGQTKVTTERTVEKSGKNPPATPATPSNP